MANALLVVDLQNDFLSGGTLAIPDSDRLVELANKLMSKFPFVIATKDWHPVKHISFHGNENPDDVAQWNPHCRMRSKGADFPPEFHAYHVEKTFYKGSDYWKESFSPFDDPLTIRYLQEEKIQRLFVMGLVTEYCVQSTVIDAIQAGIPDVVVITDACAALTECTEKTALENMTLAGARLIQSGDLLR